jgi:uncharacterized membrane protein
MFTTSHLHPMLVHFPIALVLVGFLAEIAALIFRKEAGLAKMGFYLLLIGTIAAISAWLSGNLFTAEMDGPGGQVKEYHELFANITLGLLLITSAIRIITLRQKSKNIKLKWVAFSLYALAAISVSITGFVGGKLVYEFMLGI